MGKKIDLNPGLTNEPAYEIPQQRITQDDLKSFKTMKCECGSIFFEPAFVFKVIPSLMSPTGKEETQPFPVYVCKKCGKVSKEFNDKAKYDSIIEEIKDFM